MNELNAWTPWLALLIATASFLYPILSGRAKKTEEKFIAIESRFTSVEEWVESKASKDTVGVLAGKLDIVEDKVTIVQNDLKHLPDKETTHRLELVIGELRSEVGKLSEQVKPITRMADRMQEAIMEKVMQS